LDLIKSIDPATILDIKIVHSNIVGVPIRSIPVDWVDRFLTKKTVATA